MRLKDCGEHTVSYPSDGWNIFVRWFLIWTALGLLTSLLYVVVVSYIL